MVQKVEFHGKENDFHCEDETPLVRWNRNKVSLIICFSRMVTFEWKDEKNWMLAIW